jgi:hypothetical protein
MLSSIYTGSINVDIDVSDNNGELKRLSNFNRNRVPI